MVSIDWISAITGFVGGGLGGATIMAILNHLLDVRRSKLLEERQLLQKRRVASTAVAEILSEWVARHTLIGIH